MKRELQNECWQCGKLTPTDDGPFPYIINALAQRGIHNVFCSERCCVLWAKELKAVL